MQRVFPYHGNLFSLLSSEQMQHSISDARIIIILSSPICEPISGKPIELPTVFILFVLSNSLIPFSDTNLTISAPTKPKQPIKKGLLQAAQFIEHQLNSRQPDSIKSNTLSRSLIPKSAHFSFSTFCHASIRKNSNLPHHGLVSHKDNFLASSNLDLHKHAISSISTN
ncbi:unnamed protein product [Rhodiola kirilowii]